MWFLCYVCSMRYLKALSFHLPKKDPKKYSICRKEYDNKIFSSLKEYLLGYSGRGMFQLCIYTLYTYHQFIKQLHDKLRKSPVAIMISFNLFSSFFHGY